MLSPMCTNTLEAKSRQASYLASCEGIVIVADDLTGACDSGAAFVLSGRCARVILSLASAEHRSSDPPVPGVVSFTTETRSLTAAQAGAAVAETIKALTETFRPAILFKKIDSAGRGHLGIEIIAALQASGAAMALVAPAFPSLHRTVRSGILHVSDCSGQASSIPLREQFPGVQSDLIDVLSNGPESDLLASIQQALKRGVRFLLCDAETQEDLEQLASAARQVLEPVLWAGSAGLARALAAIIPAAPSPTPISKERRSGRTLLYTGTPHPVTLLQLSHLKQRSRSRKHATVRVDYNESAKEQVESAFASEPAAALILNGGDTAAFVLQTLGASSILLAGELAAGIPWGFIEGGVADGCLVVTKSGGFGEQDTLVRAFEFCDRSVHGPA